MHRWAWACLLAFGSGCDQPSRGGDDKLNDAQRGFAVPTAVLSPRQFLFVRHERRCEIYWTEGDKIGTPAAHPCVNHLEVGERIQMVGRTCMRLSPERAERQVPVLCPNPLIDAEEAYRESFMPSEAAPADRTP